VDGPDFDGHEVDFDDLMARLKRFTEEEGVARKRFDEDCRMMKLADAATPADTGADSELY
jgi:sulfide dehydrogenase subunit beta